MPSIFLHTDPTIRGYDDSGLMFEKRAFPVYRPGSYTTELLPHDKRALSILDYVAPLEYYCIRSLFYNVDQLDLGEAPRSTSGSQLRLMKTLMPFFEHNMQPSLLSYVDPRLWATLIQVFANLPPTFRIYSLPLSDTHLPLLQNVNSSADFTLITVVDMSRRLELNDATIGELKPLINLCVLDMSGTEVTTWGVKKLSMCLTRDETSGATFGPWKLRIWSMMNCVGIKDDVKSILPIFPLLSVVDLRGTSVTDEHSFTNFTSSPTSDLHPYYYPYSTTSWIDSLWKSYPEKLFACKTEMPYVLHVHELEYSKAPPPIPARTCHSPRPSKAAQKDDGFFVLRPRHDLGGTNDRKGYGNHRDEDDGEHWHGDEDDDLHQELWMHFASEAADQSEARNFFNSGSTTTVPTKENDKDVKNEPICYPPITNKRQLRQMFFRVPPSFQKVNHSTTTNINAKKKRRIGDDEQLVHKRNAKPAAVLTKTFMEKIVGGIKRDDAVLEDEKISSSCPGGSSRMVSQNPFRFKKALKK